MSLQHELPFDVDNLLNLRVIEGNRVEFKASWNDVTRRNVIRSICAFANDVLNLNGGYIVLGAQEVDGRPSLPPAGLGNASLDRIQREIFGDCKKFIFPEYQPMICVEHVEDRPILVLCCPGGDARPYSVRDAEQPGSKVYYVRQGAVTARAENELLRQLLEVTAR